MSFKFIEPYNNYEVEILIKYNNNTYSRHERQFKYELCRLYFNPTYSVRMRDWTLGHIATRINTLRMNNKNE